MSSTYRNEVRSILYHIVAKGSRYQYNSANVLLILWVYSKPEYRETLIKPDMLLEMGQANEQEQVEGKKGALRKCIKRFVDCHAPDMDNCPLILSNMNFDYFIPTQHTHDVPCTRTHSTASYFCGRALYLSSVTRSVGTENGSDELQHGKSLSVVVGRPKESSK